MEKQQREQSRLEKLAKFDPNENGLKDHGIFGLPFTVEESELVLVSVPWEATVSYKAGAANGPQAILEASQQIDLYDPLNPEAWKKGIAMLPTQNAISINNQSIRQKVEEYLITYAEGDINKLLLEEINSASELLNNEVKKQTKDLLAMDKVVGLVGGDHSTPLGFIQALGEKYQAFGILHIDAHADLRPAYEGFEYSHASIFHNALKIKNMERLVQIGIRDFSQVEQDVVEKELGRVVMFTEYELRKALFEGSTWAKVCDTIVAQLPENVYISFDIDGLSPHLSPNTGTPVLGGFSVEELVYLFEKVLSSGKKIIGFDLCEVAPGEDEWDGNVGARVLYKLCQLALKSKK